MTQKIRPASFNSRGGALMCLVAFVSLFSVPHVVSANGQDSAARQAKQQKAEEAADRILWRFYETLDFGVVYREMFVADPALRAHEVEVVIGNILHLRHRKQKVDFAAKERAYIATWNFWWLASAASLTTDINRKEFEKNLKEPYESLTALDPIKMDVTDRFLDEKWTATMNQMSDYLRQHVSLQALNSPAYREKAERIKENQPDKAGYLKERFRGSGLRPETEIYVVRRERFYYYLIEEGAAFKLLTFSNRVRF